MSDREQLKGCPKVAPNPHDATPCGRKGLVRALGGLPHLLAELPFTILLWLAVAGTGIATGIWAHPLAPALLERWGVGLEQLWRGRWWTLLTSTLLAHGPAMYWGLLLFIPASVGVYERLAGTRRALTVYGLTAVGGALIVAFGVVLPLHLAGIELAAQLPYANDVGMSGGGFGCLGAVLGRVPQAGRRPLIVAVLAYVAARMAVSPDVWADALHLVALFAGFGLDRWLSRLGLDGRSR